MISVVIPLYNEAELVDELYSRICSSLDSINQEFELVFVDDGSTDSTLAKMLLKRADDKRVVVVELSRNFGHQQAYSAGLSYAEGELIVMMDGDLQDPPELIPTMLDKLRSESLDVVYAKRIGRKEGNVRKIMMRLFHLIFKRVMGDPNAGNVGNFSVFTTAVRDVILTYSEKSKYLPGIRFHVGFNQGHVLFNRDKRFAGKPKMGFLRLFSLAVDAIFGFTTLPIRIILLLGVTGVVLCVIGLLYVLFSKLFGVAPYGWSSTLFALFLFSSIQLLCIGLVGEYVSRIHAEVRNRPSYIIKRVLK